MDKKSESKENAVVAAAAVATTLSTTQQRIDYEAHVIRTEIGDSTLPIIVFNADALIHSKGSPTMRRLGEKFHLTFKLVHTECKIIKSLLSAYGFHEVHPSSPDFNVTWTNSHIKPGSLHSLTEFQKINHFPKSFELTRKDRLYKNIQQMQQNKGVNRFDFIPQSFLIPMEYAEFCNEFKKWRGLWIVKPLALSRGRGIYVVSRPDDLPVEEPVLVAKYIDNPFLINGYKFDLRLYVAVTSFDPLVLYLFKEGLARFATEKYRKGNRHLGNQCMHLTNYSVNRHSANYVRCYDPNVEDYGNKWSLSALMSYLQRKGFNTTVLYSQIKDIVIKALISAELPIATACKIEVPNHGNCFELFGFDILLDETMRPWLLEINFSPSLACDLPLDLKIKSKVVADLLTLTGVVAHDPLLLRFQQKRASGGPHAKTVAMTSDRKNNKLSRRPLTVEGKILNMVQGECERKGDFVCIFPTANSWDMYGEYFEQRLGYNEMLHKTLFPSVSKFNLTDVYKGPKALYSSLKSKEQSKSSRLPNKLQLAKKFVSAAFGKFDSSLSGNRRPYCNGQSSKSSYSLNKTSAHHVSVDMSSAHESDGSLDDNPVIRRLKMDETLSQIQAREVFALYLYRIGNTLDTIMSNEPVQHSRQSSLHFKQQLELVLQFLIYASDNLAIPIEIECPDQCQKIYDQGKHLLLQIERFMEAYEQETDGMSRIFGSDTREYFVDKESFSSFMETAKASELEEVLMIVSDHHSTSWFLGTSQRKEHQLDLSHNDGNESYNLGSLCNFHQFFPQRSRSTTDCSIRYVGYERSTHSKVSLASTKRVSVSLDYTTSGSSTSNMNTALPFDKYGAHLPSTSVDKGPGAHVPLQRVRSSIYKAARIYSSKQNS